MSAGALLKRVQAAGLFIRLLPSGNIKAEGSERAVRLWLPTLKDHRAELIAHLQAANDEPIANREPFDERAAIMEFDGQLDRQSAERCAHAIIFCKDCQHHIAQPDTVSKSGSIHAAPSGCTLGLITPESWPPIYAFTGWRCPQFIQVYLQENCA